MDKHPPVLTGASTAKILIRVDGAGATHGLHEHLRDRNTRRRTVRFTTGWTVTADDEKAIARLPKTAWETSVKQDGSVQEGYFVAELTGLNRRDGWIKGMRLIVRRGRPSGRHVKDLTAFEKRTVWKYSITATNISKMPRIRGSPPGFSGWMPCTATTLSSKTGCARTRRWACTTCPRSPGRSTRRGC
ncbi:hypothetical protein V1460_17265 [Streptomyces sp. SCSIO 30461]|uniref:hypothetical protein n=1 Tax=Streptomyces sp. SCSIO 30461 TaxID=3118085 RepID=UPI0030D347BF